MKCFVDMDGVLVDFMQGVHDYYGLQYSYDNYPYRNAEWDWMKPEVTGLSVEDFWETLDEGFWANLPWMPDDKEMLAAIEAVIPKKDICLLTSPTIHPSSASGKLRWIQREMPEYSRRFLIGPPKQFCAGQECVLIDDADHNICAFARNYGDTILVPRRWNQYWGCHENAIEVVKEKLALLSAAVA